MPRAACALRRTALVLAVAACLAAAALLLREPAAPVAGLLATDGSTVVVLDFSTSVSDLVYRQISRTLHEIADADGGSARVGLVLFSDTAQEALPPGTPARELVPFIRFFEPKRDPGAAGRPKSYRAAGPGAPAPTTYPLSPWFGSFSGGTRISTGLAAAREALVRDRVAGGSVLLVSDLSGAAEDVAPLAGELADYGRRGIDLRIVAVPPATDAEVALYRRAIGSERVVALASVAGNGSGFRSSNFPLAVAALVGIVALALAAHELLVVPFAWGRVRAARQ